MIHGIIPLVKGDRKRVGYEACATFIAASALGAAVLVLAFWLLLTPARTLFPGALVGVVLVVTVVAAIASDLGIIRDRVTSSRQVRQSRYGLMGPVRAYAIYGFQLGVGVFTHVPFAITYVSFLAVCLYAPLSAALVAGMAFGVGRTFLTPIFLMGGATTRGLRSASGAGNGLLHLVSVVLCLFVAWRVLW